MRRSAFWKKTLAVLTVSSMLLSGVAPVMAETVDEAAEEVLMEDDETGEEAEGAVLEEDEAFAEGDAVDETASDEATADEPVYDEVDSIDDIVEDTAETVDEVKEDLARGITDTRIACVVGYPYTIRQGADDKWCYLFRPEETAVYRFVSDGGSSDTDPLFRLYDSDGVLMEENDNSDDLDVWWNFEVYVELKANTSYFVELENIGGVSDPYTFKVEKTDKQTGLEEYSPSYGMSFSNGGEAMDLAVGEQESLWVTVNHPDDMTLKYAWYDENGSVIPGEVSDELEKKVSFNTPGDRSYSCVVSGYKNGTLIVKRTAKFDFHVTSFGVNIDRDGSGVIMSGTEIKLVAKVKNAPSGVTFRYDWDYDEPIEYVRSSGNTHTVTVREFSEAYNYVWCDVTSVDSNGKDLETFHTYYRLAGYNDNSSQAKASKTYWYSDGKNAEGYAVTHPENGYCYMRLDVSEAGNYAMDKSGTDGSNTTAIVLDAAGQQIATLSDTAQTVALMQGTYYVQYYTNYRQQCLYCCLQVSYVGAATPQIAHTHSFGAWTRTVEPTALAAGQETSVCTGCGEKQTREVAKLNAFVKLNFSGTLPLKVKQKTTKVKVMEMAAGDSVVSWTSSNPKFVTVNNSGKITAKSKAKKTVTITVTTAAGATASFKVKTQSAVVKTKKITVASKSVTLAKGAKFDLATVISPLTSTDKVKYSTSSKKIAAVKGGVITAKKKGKATITVTSGKKKVGRL